MKPPQRKPAAFRLDEISTISGDYVPGLGAPPVLTPEADAFAEAAAMQAVVRPPPKVRWTAAAASPASGDWSRSPSASPSTR